MFKNLNPAPAVNAVPLSRTPDQSAMVVQLSAELDAVKAELESEKEAHAAARAALDAAK